MLEEIEDLIYQWKMGVVTRDQVEDKVIDVVITYEQLRRERLHAQAAANENTTPHERKSL
jgi:hypothetical protein